jgi:Protein of unknown function (DUF1592)/Protein of unknown function (DUF1588)/Protein of unknown function (DUF1595)/Protein of unknown function (DUF1587)/Protein of unknown function (DUF1585)
MATGQDYGRVGMLVLGLTMGSGCYAGIHDHDDGGLDGGDAGEDGGEDAGEDDGGDDGLGPADEMPAATTRFFRLTHAQWENTVQDLLQLPEPTGLSSEFRADPFVGGFIFDNNAVSLEVDQALWSGYQRAAVAVAELAAGDPTIIAAIAPADAADEAARAREFVTDFGLRAFRRPLTDEELATYEELFQRGPELYDDTTGFEAGVRLVLEGMLQSPHFLYRVEGSEDIAGDVIPLDSWEIASRLSYFLLNTMPDEALLAAAAADELRDAEAVRTQALRMLETPRAAAVVERFHHQLLQVDRFGNADPSPAFYPDAPEGLGLLATEEHRQFVRHTVFEQDGSWGDLLTSTETFVNGELAKLYGLPGEFGTEFTRVDLDPAERRGLFTQIGFLVANSTSANPDPIHRGVFLAKHIACHGIAAPPDEIPPIPAPDETQTNREAIEALTEVAGSECVGCHSSLINPFGFALEGYDATGAFRTVDNDKPVDSASNVLLGDGPVPVSNGVELAEALAADAQVHECYAQHWLEFAMARPHEETDTPLTGRLATESLEDLSVKELLVELTVSRPFLTRSAEEM